VAKETASSSTEPENNDELEQITIARALLNYRLKEKMSMSNPNARIPFQKKFQIQNIRPTSSQSPATTSKILPLICQKTGPRNRPSSATANENPRSRHPPAAATSDKSILQQPQSSAIESRVTRPLRFPAAGAPPYVPIRQMRPCHGIAPAVSVRTVIPVFSAPPLPPPTSVHQIIRAPPVRIAPPVSIRQAVPVFAAPPLRKDEPAPVQKDLPASSTPVEQDKLPAKILEMDKTENNSPPQPETLQSLEQLKI
jgi:hypothetical protein